MAAGCSFIFSIDMYAKMCMLIFIYAINPNLPVKKKKKKVVFTKMSNYAHENMRPLWQTVTSTEV